MNASRGLTFPALAIVGLALLGAAPAVAPAPHPEVQKALDRLVAVERAASSGTPLAEGEPPPSPPSPAALDAVVELAGGRPALLTQLLLYLAAAPSTETAMPGAILLHRLEFTVAEKVEVAVPLLRAPENATVRAARSLLASVDREPGPELDFAPYLPHLEDGDAEATRDLAAYMIETDPDTAFAALRTAFAAADARPWSEAPFARLAGDSRWWVRLYAASLAVQHPDLATSPAGVTLAADPVPQVRRVLANAAAAEGRPTP